MFCLVFPLHFMHFTWKALCENLLRVWETSQQTVFCVSGYPLPMLAIPKVTPKYGNGMERKRINHITRAGEEFLILIYASKSIQTPASSYSCLYFPIEIGRQTILCNHRYRHIKTRINLEFMWICCRSKPPPYNSCSTIFY